MEDSQRKAMFARMGASGNKMSIHPDIMMRHYDSMAIQPQNSFLMMMASKKPREVVPMKEEFAIVGKGLAYRGVLDGSDGNLYEIFVPNIFEEDSKSLQSLATYRGSDLSDVAADILSLREEQSLPISDQQFVDVSTLPALHKIGYDKGFEGEVFEYVSEGLPKDREFEDWSDVVEYQRDVFEKAQDWKPKEVVEPEVIVKERVVQKVVPVSDEDELSVSGSTVGVLDESAGVYQYNYPDTITVEPQEVRRVETFDKFFGTPTVSRLNKTLGELEDEL